MPAALLYPRLTHCGLQVPHWPCVKRTAHLIPLSHSEAVKERDAESTLSAMAGLTVQHRHGQPPAAHQSPPPPPPSCRSVGRHRPDELAGAARVVRCCVCLVLRVNYSSLEYPAHSGSVMVCE